MRSYTGAIISAIVFAAILFIAAIHMIQLIADSHSTFQKHGPIQGYFEGAGTTSQSELTLAGINQDEMTVDQMDALDLFYVGVGFATTKQF